MHLLLTKLECGLSTCADRTTEGEAVLAAFRPRPHRRRRSADANIRRWIGAGTHYFVPRPSQWFVMALTASGSRSSQPRGCLISWILLRTLDELEQSLFSPELRLPSRHWNPSTLTEKANRREKLP
jgi:hypothetical protein